MQSLRIYQNENLINTEETATLVKRYITFCQNVSTISTMDIGDPTVIPVNKQTNSFQEA